MNFQARSGMRPVQTLQPHRNPLYGRDCRGLQVTMNGSAKHVTDLPTPR